MRARPTLEHVVMVACVVIAAASVSGALADNSLMVHLTTGKGIVDSWSIPRADPYSFTAAGEPWVVQSWLVSVLYGLADSLGGERMVTVLHVCVAALAMAAMVVAGRSATMIRTIATMGIPVVLAVLTWTQRPTLFGLCAFAAVVLVVHKRLSPWLLLPVMWLWVNMHGSFPVGLAWVAAVFVGSWLDERHVDKIALKQLAFVVLGTLLGAVNPLGPRILLFATELIGDKADSFEAILEWRSPDFHTVTGALSLVLLVALIGAGFAGRVRWRYGLGVIAVLGASLYSARYMAILPIAAVPFMAALVAQLPGGSAKEANPVEQSRDTRIAAMSLLACVVILGGVLLRVEQQPATNLDDYPVAAIDWMQHNGLLRPETRLAATDVAGCYLIWRYDGEQKVFIDDRVDMYPSEVSKAYRGLVELDRPYDPVLEEYRIDTVLWPNDKALANALAADDQWRVAWQDGDWTVFVAAQPGGPRGLPS